MFSVLLKSQDVIADTADVVRVDNSDKRVQQIEKVVLNTIKHLLDDVAAVKPLFKASEILKVGGYSEGTKILYPNEFDYLIVLEELSKPGVVSVELDESEAGIARVKVNEIHNKDGKWDEYLKNGYVRCMQIGRKFEKFELFGLAVIKAIRTMYKGDGRSGYVNMVTHQPELELFGKHPDYSLDVFTLEKACIKRAEVQFPNVVLSFVVENIDIDVDICPAIRYHNVAECFSPEYCASPVLSQAVLTRGSILLVAQLDDKCRITFTETEVDYIKTRMLPRHKQLYIYLKYMAGIANAICRSKFSSYSLKMSCIWHDLRCQRSEGRLLPCLSDVIFLYYYSITSEHLPSVFNTKLNLIRSISAIGVGMSRASFDIPVSWYLRKVPALAAKVTDIQHHKEDLHRLFNDAKEQTKHLRYPDHDQVIETLYCRDGWRYECEKLVAMVTLSSTNFNP